MRFNPLPTLPTHFDTHGSASIPTDTCLCTLRQPPRPSSAGGSDTGAWPAGYSRHPGSWPRAPVVSGARNSGGGRTAKVKPQRAPHWSAPALIHARTQLGDFPHLQDMSESHSADPWRGAACMHAKCVQTHRRLGADHEPVLNAVEVERDELLTELIGMWVVGACHAGRGASGEPLTGLKGERPSCRIAPPVATQVTPTGESYALSTSRCHAVNAHGAAAAACAGSECAIRAQGPGSGGIEGRDAWGRDGDRELREKGRKRDWEHARGVRRAGASHTAAHGPGLLPRSSRCLPSRGERASAATMR